MVQLLRSGGVYVPADDLTDLLQLLLSLTWMLLQYLSRKIAELGIYPAVDPLDSTSRIFGKKYRW